MISCGAYSIPEIIFSYSSLHGMWECVLAFASSFSDFSKAAITTVESISKVFYSDFEVTKRIDFNVLS